MEHFCKVLCFSSPSFCVNQFLIRPFDGPTTTAVGHCGGWGRGGGVDRGVRRISGPDGDDLHGATQGGGRDIGEGSAHWQREGICQFLSLFYGNYKG